MTGADVTITIGSDLKAQITDAENQIKKFQEFCGDQARIIKEHFTNGWSGMTEVSQQIAGLKTALSGIEMPKGFTGALTQINKAASGSSEDLQKFIEALSKMQTALQQNVAGGAKDASTNLDTTASSANNAANAISNLAQQAAKLKAENSPTLGTSTIALGANDPNNAVANGQITQTIALIDEWKKQIEQLRIKYAQLKGEEQQSSGDARATATAKVNAIAQEIVALKSKIKYIEQSAEEQAKQADKESAAIQKNYMQELKAISDSIEARKKASDAATAATQKEYAERQKMYEELFKQADKEAAAMQKYYMQELKAITDSIEARKKASEAAERATQKEYAERQKMYEELFKQADKEYSLRSRLQSTDAIQSQMEAIKAKILELNDATAKWKSEVSAASTIFEGFGGQNQIIKTIEELAALDNEIRKLKAQQEQLNASDGQQALTAKINELTAQYRKLDETITELEKLKYKLRLAEQEYQKTLDGSSEKIQKLQAEYASLEQELKRIPTANAAIKDALSKGYTMDSLKKEYAELAQQAEKYYAQMQAYQAKYGGAASAADTSAIADGYRQVEQQYQQAQARMNEIAQINSDIRTQYDTQKSVEAFQKEMTEYQKLQQQKKDAQAKADYNRVSTADAISNAASAKSYDERAKAIKDCQAALQRLDTTQERNVATANTLVQHIQTLTKAQKDYKAAVEGTTVKSFTEVKGVANAALQSKNLNDLSAAYKELQRTMNGMQYGSTQWNTLNGLLQRTKTQIDEIKTKMGELKTRQSDLMNISAQLAQRLAMVFSVTAIKGYIEKLVQVRAQFELQRIALGAILQDTEKANEVFKQVQSMALESPFSIMQLERATKQIAAFGVEADKLKPSIKMLADISAGLGVDIDRLILVYGHIKANNALQQLHVRQFTNAGFNIAGELAKYYTELEGKMVSVSEVTDRIHKKLVSFADVEEVLKRVTSAGGMFYDMQKKQSDSLWGQMQRIKDQMDLMLNEIGQSNQSSISGALTLVRSLIKHWRDFAVILKMIMYSLAAWAAKKFLIGGLVAIASKATIAVRELYAGMALVNAETKKGAALMTLFGNSIKSAFVTSGIGVLIVAFTYLFAKAMMVNGELAQMNEEITRIKSDTMTNVSNMTYQFTDLANKAVSVSSSYKEQKQALEDLKRIYGDVLPVESLEIENLKALHGNYKELTDAIREYEIEKGKSLLRDTMNAQIDKSMNDAKSEIMQYAKEFSEVNTKLTDVPESVIKGEISNIFDTMAAEMKAGTLKLESQEDFMNEFKKRFASYFQLDNVILPEMTEYRNQLYSNLKLAGSLFFGWADTFGDESLSWTDRWGKSITNSFNDNINGIKAVLDKAPQYWTKDLFTPIGGNIKVDYFSDAYDDIQRITDLYGDASTALGEFSSYEDAQLSKTTEAYKENLESRMQLLDTYRQALQAIYDLKQKGQYQNEDGSFTTLGASANQDAENALYRINVYLKSIGQAKVEVKDLNDIIASNVTIEEHFGDVGERVMKGFKANLERVNDYANNKFLQKLGDNIDEKIENIGGTEVQRRVRSMMEEISKSMGVPLSVFDEIKVSGADTFDTVAKSVKGLIDRYKELIEQWDSIANKFTAGILDPKKQAELVTGMSEEGRKTAEVVIKVFEMLFTGVGGVEKKTKTGKGKDTVSETWKNRLKAIQDYYKQYDELIKNYSDTKALEIAQDAYRKYFSSLKLDIDKVSARGMDKQGAMLNVNALLEQVRGIRHTLIDEFEKAAGDYKMEIGVDAQVEGLDNLTHIIDQAFDNYELTKTFKDLNLNVDLTKMVGGVPTTLDDILKLVEDNIDEFSKYGKEGEKKLEEYSKKFTQTEQKELQERIKNYAKYLTKAYGEEASFQLDAYAKMKQIRDDFDKQATSDPDNAEMYRRQADDAIKALREEMAAKLAEFDFKDLMESNLFTDVFQDLSTASSKVLDLMADKIRTVRKESKDLSMSQIRQLAQYLEKIQTAKIENGSIKQSLNAIKAAYKLRKQGKTLGSLSDQLAVGEANLDSLNTYKNDIQLVMGLKDKTKDIDQKDVKLTDQQGDLNKMNVVTLQGILAVTNKQITSQQQQNSETQEGIDTFKAAQTAAKLLGENIQNMAKAASAGIDVVTNSIVMFGGEIDDVTQVWLDYVQSSIESTAQLAMEFVALGTEINSAAGIIGIIAEALTLVAGLFSTIINAGDTKKETEIKRLKNYVEDLQDAYEKLGDAIEKAFSVDQYESGYQNSLVNIQQQIDAYKEMIALEEAKKKTDEDSIREYQKAIADLEDDLAELKEQRVTDLGGFGESNYRDIAEDFVSAWLDAYKETGDGLDALQDQWEDYMENLFLKQAAITKAGKLYSKAMSIIDEAIDSGKSGTYLEQAIAQAREAADGASEDLNKYLQALAGVFGISQEGENTLSDLQQGISNITEAQAAAIEAYLNSIRFYVASQDSKLSELATLIRQQYTSGNNPMLTVVKEIRDAVQAFSSKLSSALVQTGGKWKLQVV